LRRAVPAVVEEVTAMGNITFDIKDHPFLNDVFEKGVVEGFDKGRLEGETHGRAETLLRLMRRRYGAVPDSVIDRVHAAGIEDLDRWADAVLTPPAWMPCSIRRSTETARSSQAASPFRKH
jgi:hypothetical protein